jgi:hypothetical protein
MFQLLFSFSRSGGVFAHVDAATSVRSEELHEPHGRSRLHVRAVV